MQPGHDAPTPSGAGPRGSDGGAVGSGVVRSDAGSDGGRGEGAPPAVPGGLDPLFQGEEVADRATPRATLLFQFFLFPLLIVLASVGVFLFFGAIGGSERSPDQYLDLVANGGTNEQKQAAHQLGVALEKERRRVEQKEIPLKDAFYIQDPGFRAKLGKAFEASFTDQTSERQIFLAISLGFVGDPAYRPLLEAHVGPTTPPDVRRAVAQALSNLETEPGDSVHVLAGLLKDPDDAVRNYAVQGLSRHKTPESVEALKAALHDDDVFVQANAAGALALLGDDSGRDLLAKLLDPAWVDRIVATPSSPGSSGSSDASSAVPIHHHAAMRAAALSNGIRGAAALHADDLRPKIEALKDDPDRDVRDLARDVLDHWPSPK